MQNLTPEELAVHNAYLDLTSKGYRCLMSDCEVTWYGDTVRILFEDAYFGEGDDDAFGEATL